MYSDRVGSHQQRLAMMYSALSRQATERLLLHGGKGLQHDTRTSVIQIVDRFQTAAQARLLL